MCWRRPADGDKSPELSVAEREPRKRDHLRKEKKKPSVHFCNRRTQKTAMKLRAVTSKFIFCSGEINSLAQEQSVNHFGAFMSV